MRKLLDMCGSLRHVTPSFASLRALKGFEDIYCIESVPLRGPSDSARLTADIPSAPDA